jgi:hypothetical protein
MPFVLSDDDAHLRETMLSEFESDASAGEVFASAVAIDGSERQYHLALREAITDGTPDSLVEAFLAGDLFKDHQANGNRVNRQDAAMRLGDGQFLHYYNRAVCIRAIELNRSVEIYRGQMTAHHRPESDAAIGLQMDPEELLESLRSNSEQPWKVGVLAQVNSGLAIKVA